MDNVFGAWLAFALPGFIFLLAVIYVLFSLGGCCMRMECAEEELGDLYDRVERLERIIEDCRQRKER